MEREMSRLRAQIAVLDMVDGKAEREAEPDPAPELDLEPNPQLAVLDTVDGTAEREAALPASDRRWCSRRIGYYSNNR